MPADWEPAPPSVLLKRVAARLDEMPGTALLVRAIAADVAAMERRLAEYARKERADAE